MDTTINEIVQLFFMSKNNVLASVDNRKEVGEFIQSHKDELITEYKKFEGKEYKSFRLSNFKSKYHSLLKWLDVEVIKLTKKTAIKTVKVGEDEISGKTYLNEQVVKKLKLDMSAFENIELVPCEKAEIVLYSRQSIGESKNLSPYTAGFTSMLMSCQQLDFSNVSLWFDYGLTGYDSNLKNILVTYNVNTMVYDYSRAFRNGLEMGDCLKLAWERQLEVYNLNMLISEGSGLILALIMSVFTEFDLSTKQTSISGYHLEITQCLLRQITYDELPEDAKKTFDLIRFAGRDSYIAKLKVKTAKIISERDEINKAGNQKWSDSIILICEQIQELL